MSVCLYLCVSVKNSNIEIVVNPFLQDRRLLLLVVLPLGIITPMEVMQLRRCSCMVSLFLIRLPLLAAELLWLFGFPLQLLFAVRSLHGLPFRVRLPLAVAELLWSSLFGFRAGPAEIRPSPVAVDAGHERPSPLDVRSPRARSAKSCALRGGQPRAARQCGSFGGSAIQRKQGPSCSLLVAARDLGSRPPIVAEVGGLGPSVPLVLLLVGESLGR